MELFTWRGKRNRNALVENKEMYYLRRRRWKGSSVARLEVGSPQDHASLLKGLLGLEPAEEA